MAMASVNRRLLASSPPGFQMGPPYPEGDDHCRHGADDDFLVQSCESGADLYLESQLQGGTENRMVIQTQSKTDTEVEPIDVRASN